MQDFIKFVCMYATPKKTKDRPTFCYIDISDSGAI